MCLFLVERACTALQSSQRQCPLLKAAHTLCVLFAMITSPIIPSALPNSVTNSTLLSPLSPTPTPVPSRFCLVSVVLFNLILKNNALGTVCTALASLVVMITYLVGSIKLTAVMNGSKSVARQLKIVQLAARRIVFWLGIYVRLAHIDTWSVCGGSSRSVVY